jgi:hypothetical protein
LTRSDWNPDGETLTVHRPFQIRFASRPAPGASSHDFGLTRSDWLGRTAFWGRKHQIPGTKHQKSSKLQKTFPPEFQFPIFDWLLAIGYWLLAIGYPAVCNLPNWCDWVRLSRADRLLGRKHQPPRRLQAPNSKRHSRRNSNFQFSIGYRLSSGVQPPKLVRPGATGSDAAGQVQSPKSGMAIGSTPLRHEVAPWEGAATGTTARNPQKRFSRLAPITPERKGAAPAALRTAMSKKSRSS